MYAAENPKFSAEIAGKQSFFCFGKYFSELVKKQFGQAWCETWGSVALVLCCPCTNVNQGRYRTKSVWRLCTPSACKFPVIFHKNAREYIQYSLRFLFHLTKNLTTHLSHNLCAVLPRIISNRAMRVRFSSRIIFPRRDFHGRYSVFFQRSRRTAL